MSVSQVGILPAPNYQLPLALGSGHVDARFLQVTQVLRAVPWIDDVEGPVALREALLDEGEKHSVLLFFAVEEGTDMPGAVEDRTRQPYLLWVAHCMSPFCQRKPAAGWSPTQALGLPASAVVHLQQC